MKSSSQEKSRAFKADNALNNNTCFLVIPMSKKKTMKCFVEHSNGIYWRYCFQNSRLYSSLCGRQFWLSSHFCHAPCCSLYNFYWLSWKPSSAQSVTISMWCLIIKEVERESKACRRDISGSRITFFQFTAPLKLRRRYARYFISF